MAAVTDGGQVEACIACSATAAVSPDRLSTTASGLAAGTGKQLWAAAVTYSAKAPDPLQVTASPTCGSKDESPALCPSMTGPWGIRIRPCSILVSEVLTAKKKDIKDSKCKCP